MNKIHNSFVSKLDDLELLAYEEFYFLKNSKPFQHPPDFPKPECSDDSAVISFIKKIRETRVALSGIGR